VTDFERVRNRLIELTTESYSNVGATSRTWVWRVRLHFADDLTKEIVPALEGALAG
jgi:hypothetical protein